MYSRFVCRCVCVFTVLYVPVFVCPCVYSSTIIIRNVKLVLFSASVLAGHGRTKREIERRRREQLAEGSCRLFRRTFQQQNETRIERKRKVIFLFVCCVSCSLVSVCTGWQNFVPGMCSHVSCNHVPTTSSVGTDRALIRLFSSVRPLMR